MGQTSDGPVQGPDGGPDPVVAAETKPLARTVVAARQLYPIRRWRTIAVALGVAAIGMSLLVPSARHQWALSVFRQPARYTAISFDAPAKLPAAAFWNQAIPISFTVTNQQGRATTYRYVLSENGDGHSRVIGGASRMVAPGASWDVSTTVRPTCSTSPCQVKISLPGHPETLDFNVNLQPGG